MQSPYEPLIAVLAAQQGLSVQRLQMLRQEADNHRRSFVRALLDEQVIDAETLLDGYAQLGQHAIADVMAIALPTDLLTAVDERLVRHYRLLPIFVRAGRVFVATDDPYQTQGLAALKYAGGFTAVEPVVAHAGHIQNLIDAHFTGHHHLDKHLTHRAEVRIDTPSENTAPVARLNNGDSHDSDSPVVTYVSEVLSDAIRLGVSDVHFEPYEHRFRVRFRQDGVLREMSAPDKAIAPRITSRLKVMAGIDIAEKRIPQDGRIQLPLEGARVVDFRVNTLPTLWGEKVVLRLLNSDASKLDIAQLGLTPPQYEQYQAALKKPQGLIVVTGPTGSGKTTSLYAGLHQLNQVDVNILTVEDPIEITLPGINQVNVNNKQGLSFATALRAFLRQDPDIMMVGEMRDLETAEIAIKAAQTGHLVLSTLHTNDASQTLMRLANMGVKPYNLAASLMLLMAQRLLRCLCPQCKREDTRWSLTQLAQFGFTLPKPDHVTLFRAATAGCHHCGGQGYKGRTGVYQVVTITPTLSKMIRNHASAAEFSAQFEQAGFIDLRQAALLKVQQGMTSIDEMLRLTLATEA